MGDEDAAKSGRKVCEDKEDAERIVRHQPNAPSEGYFARHLRRMRTHYRDRRQTLVDEMERLFGRDVEISLQAGGLHILARFPNHWPDVELANRALEHGLAPFPLSDRFLKHRASHGQSMSFTNIPEQEAADVVASLREAIARNR